MALGNDQIELSYAVTAYHANRDNGPSFGIPLVSTAPTGNSLYVQDCDERGNVVGFTPITGVSSVSLAEAVPVKAGGPVVFAIIDPTGTPLVGTQAALKELVKPWVYDVDHPLTRLTLLEFCQDLDGAAAAAAETFSQKKHRRGRGNATYWFAEAIILPRLIRALSPELESLDDDELSADILSIKIHSVRNSLKVTLPDRLYSAYERAAAGKSQDYIGWLRLLSQSASDINLRIVTPKSSRTKNTHSRNRFPQFDALIFALTREIETLSRQEERIAQLISHIADNPAVGLEIGRSLKPKAEFESFAVNLLLQAIPIDPKSETHFDNLLTSCIKNIYAGAYPRQRGYVLLAIANRVKNVEVLKEVNRIASASTARDVRNYAPAIRSLLPE